MSVVEWWWQQSPGGDAESPIQASLERKMFFRVDSLLDDETVIGAHVAIPAYLASHPNNALATRRGISIRRFKAFIWEVLLHYSTAPITTTEKQKATVSDPKSRTPRIRLKFTRIDEHKVKNKQGQALINSAGDPFTEPITRKRSLPLIEGTSWHASWPSFMFDLIDKINQEALTIKGRAFSAETLQFIPGGISDEQEENGITFYEANWTLEYRDSWVASRLDAGFNYWSGANRLPIEIDGETPKTPQLLNGAGGILANPSPATAVFIDEDVETVASFASVPGVTV